MTQPAILAPIPTVGRYLSYTLHGSADEARAALTRLAAAADGQTLVVGVGQSLALALGRPLAGLAPFPQIAAPGIDAPSTPAALWCWLRGDDAGTLLLRAHELTQTLAPAFEVQTEVGAFCHGGQVDRDLSGYEDGTENPKGAEAAEAALAADGGSFVAVQQWVHDLRRMNRLLASGQMDAAIGRERTSNDELEDAPARAHVKRSEQESFTPEAHLLRRSMPWADGGRSGLMLVAFGHSLAAFEAQWRRMMGEEDGVTDALFDFTRPVSGAYFWCPPLHGGRLDLRTLGL
ncbi:MAG: Dyp-type peroxidase [Proteobacteria bacterium]|nr:Dyp-type peroxidase [Pseudomonadota bacterium]